MATKRGCHVSVGQSTQRTVWSDPKLLPLGSKPTAVCMLLCDVGYKRDSENCTCPFPAGSMLDSTIRMLEEDGEAEKEGACSFLFSLLLLSACHKNSFLPHVPSTGASSIRSRSSYTLRRINTHTQAPVLRGLILGPQGPFSNLLKYQHKLGNGGSLPYS